MGQPSASGNDKEPEAGSGAPETVDGLIRLGIAQRDGGDPDYRTTFREAAELALARGDTQRLLQAVLAADRGPAGKVGDVDGQWVSLIEAGLARLDLDEASRALLLAELCKEESFASPLARRVTLAEEALSLATASPDETTFVRVSNAVTYPLLVPPLLERSLDRSAEALRRAQRCGDPELTFWAASRRFQLAATAGNVREMDRCLDLGEAPAQLLADLTPRWMQTVHRGARALIAGDLKAAETLADDGLRLAIEGGQPAGALFYGAAVMTLSWQRGTLADLGPLIEKMAEEHPRLPVFRAVIALARVEAGDLGSARDALDAVVAGHCEFPLDPSWLVTMALYSEVAIVTRDRVGAEAIFERLAPWRRRLAFSDPAPAGPVGEFLGGLATTLGRYEDADSYFSEAAHYCGRAGAEFFRARVDLRWGAMLAEWGRPGMAARARALLTSAGQRAADRGYGGVERQAREALAALG